MWRLGTPMQESFDVLPIHDLEKIRGVFPVYLDITGDFLVDDVGLFLTDDSGDYLLDA